MALLDAIFFDIDDTLFPTTEFAQRARWNAVKAMVAAGLDRPEQEVYDELCEVISEFTSNYGRHYDHLLKRLGPDAVKGINPALVVAAGVAAYHDTKFREIAPFDDVMPLLKDLHGTGMLVGIITHGWTAKQAEKLLRLQILPYLDGDAIYISEQVGISKPNPKLYTHALARHELEPGRVMYVGDNPEHDIAPPRKLGMVTTWSSRAARRTLTEAGVVADHSVSSFEQLRIVLRQHYKLSV
ncbi:MAG: putative hydrolase of the HAD superfamily [Candidatus Paceibacteria bacterium]|jgi:putative hydrolase of the HAD superfamily